MKKSVSEKTSIDPPRLSERKKNLPKTKIFKAPEFDTEVRKYFYYTEIRKDR